MRISVQRRLGLPLDAACQAAAAGKKTRNKKIHDEFGDAAVNVPQQSHNTRHKCVLQRLILALRAAWGTAVRMEPKGHLGQSYNKQPDVDACNIGRGGKGWGAEYIPPTASRRRERTRFKSMGSPIPEWFDSTQTRSGEGLAVRWSQTQ